jgi:DNA invertase Pin-like site-specific DNA recombinase
VIAYALRRFSRSIADHHGIVTLLRGIGIMLRSVTEPIDESKAGRLMEDIVAALAQFNIAVRQGRPLRVRRRRHEGRHLAILGRL